MNEGTEGPVLSYRGPGLAVQRLAHRGPDGALNSSAVRPEYTLELA